MSEELVIDSIRIRARTGTTSKRIQEPMLLITLDSDSEPMTEEVLFGRDSISMRARAGTTSRHFQAAGFL